MRAFKKLTAVMLAIGLIVGIFPLNPVSAYDIYSEKPDEKYYMGIESDYSTYNMLYNNSKKFGMLKSSMTKYSQNLFTKAIKNAKNNVSKLKTETLYTQANKTKYYSKGKSVNLKGMDSKTYAKMMTNTWSYLTLTGNYYNVEVDFELPNISNGYDGWTDLVVNKGKPDEYTYDYYDLVDKMRALTWNPGVHLYEIGRTTGTTRKVNGKTKTTNKPIYALEISEGTDEYTIIATAGVSGSDVSSSLLLLKATIDLMNDWADEKSYARELLSKTRIVVVPFANPDAYVSVTAGNKNTKIVYSDDVPPYKSIYGDRTIGGINLNRDFLWSGTDQIRYSSVAKKTIKLTQPSALGNNSIGNYVGSSAETQALMQLLYFYIGYSASDKATVFLNFTQGNEKRIMGSPTWFDSVHETQSNALAITLTNTLDNVLLAKSDKYQYLEVGEGDFTSINGRGGTIVDFAETIATGAKYSAKYGYFVYELNKGSKASKYKYDSEIPLVKVGTGGYAYSSKYRTGNRLDNFAAVTIQSNIPGNKMLTSNYASAMNIETEYDRFDYEDIFEDIYKCHLRSFK